MRGNMVLGRRPVSLREAYSDEQIVEHIASAERRIAELEAALSTLVSALGAPDCGEISEPAEAACNHAIDVLAN